MRFTTVAVCQFAECIALKCACFYLLKGRSCERCLLGFIGHDGVCNPCSEKCNKNADECKVSLLHNLEEIRTYLVYIYIYIYI